ncbi:hypothetical protein ZHAS_00016390 [Anopheles sinensis]|uniref:Uncharacterized protein n=1 Tax=Anopheles sinensis TaxID=74873 RepID=A0A084WDH1_ANOSI|nr:hypothetical protein ZHAS_00016390 [Anopheles sinensis]
MVRLVRCHKLMKAEAEFGEEKFHPDERPNTIKQIVINCRWADAVVKVVAAYFWPKNRTSHPPGWTQTTPSRWTASRHSAAKQTVSGVFCSSGNFSQPNFHVQCSLKAGCRSESVIFRNG